MYPKAASLRKKLRLLQDLFGGRSSAGAGTGSLVLWYAQRKASGKFRRLPCQNFSDSGSPERTCGSDLHRSLKTDVTEFRYGMFKIRPREITVRKRSDDTWITAVPYLVHCLAMRSISSGTAMSLISFWISWHRKTGTANFAKSGKSTALLLRLWTEITGRTIP